MTHPWRRLRALSHINLLWHDGGPMGETDFVAGTISLRRGLNQAELRSTILHECLHVERGPVPMALAWAQGDVAAAAEELWVDEETLRDRLRFMTHPTERGYLARRLGDAQAWT
jgi:hypothetical protein